MNKNIYFDNNATTALDQRVLEVMMPYLTEKYGNASSSHDFGVEINQAVENARKQIAKLLNCNNNEIFFTSGSTESINWVIKGIAEQYRGKGNHIITTQIEHSAVLESCNYLENKGYKITYLPVKKNGIVSLEALKKALNKETILVTIMYVNNEIGTIQPIREIASIVNKTDSLFFTDATQAVGKIPINLNNLTVDLLTFSGHKMYGPKGVGGLFIRKKNPSIKISPLLHGGGQENSQRSGTLNVPGIIGVGKAAEIAQRDMKKNNGRIRIIRDLIESELLKIKGSCINGDREERINNTINIRFDNVDSKALIMRLRNISISAGSACSAHSVKPSHVLKSIGLSDNEANSSIRISLGRMNTKREVSFFVNEITQAIDYLRKFD